MHTVKPPISGPLICGHLPQPDGYNLNNFKKDRYTLFKHTLLVD